MKNKLRKQLCMLIAVIMTVAALAGCGAGKETEEPVESTPAVSESQEKEEASEEAEEVAEESKEITFPLEEPVEFTSFSIKTNEYELKDNLAFLYAQERANVKIDVVYSLDGAEAAEKSNLLAASGDYPDVFFKPGGINYDQLGEDGVLIPLQDLIREYAPNLTKLLDERSGWEAVASPDGNIYNLPMFNISTVNGDHIFWINQTWLDNLDLDMPTDLDSFYEVLKAFKEQDADGDGDPSNEVPIAFYNDVPAWLMFALYDEEAFANLDYMALITGENNLEFFANTDYHKKILNYCKKLYDEGIMDPNAFTQTRDEAIAKYTASNNVGCFPMFAPNGFVSDEYGMEFVAMYPFNEQGGAASTGVIKGGAAITDKCENPEVFVAWCDYFYTEEGSILADMGIEGKTYKVNDDGTYDYLFDLGECYGKPKDVIQGGGAAPMLIPKYRFNINKEANPELALAYQQRLAVYEEATVVPALTLTQEEKDAVSDRWVEVKNYVGNYTAEVITGVTDMEASWDEYVKTLDSMGIADIFEVYNAAWHRASK